MAPRLSRFLVFVRATAKSSSSTSLSSFSSSSSGGVRSEDEDESESSSYAAGRRCWLAELRARDDEAADDARE